jgi:Spy/CpxP family protein refolding chaperone
MESARKIRILYWVVAILAIFNISLLATIFLMPDHEGNWDREHAKEETQNKDQRHYFSRMLNLTAAQQVVFDSSRSEFRREADSVFSGITRCKEEMFKELSSGNPDSVKLNEIAANMGLLHTQLKLSTIHHFLMLRKECTPEQQVILSKIFGRMITNEGHYQGGGHRFRESRKPAPYENPMD